MSFRVAALLATPEKARLFLVFSLEKNLKNTFGFLRPTAEIDFSFSHESFGEVGQFWELNETTHEIDS